MEFTVGSGGLPVGAYSAIFVGAEPYTENVEKYGPGVSLKFRVVGGEHNGEDATRICSAKLTPKSSLGKFAVALKGGSVIAGERFNFANYVGTAGSIIVEATDNGGSRISTFLKMAQPAPVQAAPVQAAPVQAAPAQPAPATQQEF